jgi:hypothetical protein
MMMAEYAAKDPTARKLGEVAVLTVDMTYSVTRYLLELAAAMRPEVRPLLEKLDAAIESSR